MIRHHHSRKLPDTDVSSAGQLLCFVHADNLPPLSLVKDARYSRWHFDATSDDVFACRSDLSNPCATHRKVRPCCRQAHLVGRTHGGGRLPGGGPA